MKYQISDTSILKERLALIYNSSIFSSLGMLSIGSILVIVLRNEIPYITLLLWYSYLLAASFLMLSNYYWYLQDIKNGIKNPIKWMRRFIFLSYFFGFVWSLASILFIPEITTSHQTMLEMAILGVVAGSIGMVSPSLKSILIFIPLCLVPLLFMLTINQTENGTTIVIMIFVYFATALYNSKIFNNRINLQLKLQAEAKYRELILQDNQQKYQVLYENSQDPMMIFSNNLFVMANQAAVKILGYDTYEQLLSVPAISTSPKYQEDGTESIIKASEIAKIINKQGSHRFEWTYKRSDGEQRPADVTISLVPYEGSVAAFCIMRDIKESKKLQEDLLEAKKESELANMAKSEFLANMSHEIRTPMNGVIGINNIMLQYPLSDDQKERAMAIQNSADSMLAIINDILDFSKIEAGKLNIELSKFNFNNLILELSSTILNRIEDKNLEYVYHIDPKLDSWFLGDSIRIRQVLENLLENALKFTNSGSIQISCSVFKDNKTSTNLKIEIIDTGVGISKDRHELIFNRFIQADGSTTRKFGGTGLGLSICKQLVELMGGIIGFESIKDKGSTFWVILQLQKITNPVYSKPELNKNTPINNNFSGKALIVDDHEINRMVVQGMLELYNNLEIHTVDDGKKAIQAINNNHFDIVFMDCHMPIMDGYEATRVIRKIEAEKKLPRVPIIAITASAMLGDKDKCLDNGMDDYLSKPFEIEDLEDKLSQWL